MVCLSVLCVSVSSPHDLSVSCVSVLSSHGLSVRCVCQSHHLMVCQFCVRQSHHLMVCQFCVSLITSWSVSLMCVSIIISWSVCWSLYVSVSSSHALSVGPCVFQPCDIMIYMPLTLCQLVIFALVFTLIFSPSSQWQNSGCWVRWLRLQRYWFSYCFSAWLGCSCCGIYICVWTEFVYQPWVQFTFCEKRFQTCID